MKEAIPKMKEIRETSLQTKRRKKRKRKTTRKRRNLPPLNKLLLTFQSLPILHLKSLMPPPKPTRDSELSKDGQLLPSSNSPTTSSKVIQKIKSNNTQFLE
jgi:hypothetical protein